MSVITLVLADDHHLVRQGFRALLEKQPDIRVLGEAGDGPQTLAVVERLQPDVLVLDLMLPGLSGLEIIRRAPALSPRTHVLVLSMHISQPYVLEALRHGATGYLPKDVQADELVRAVRAVAAGQRYLSERVSEQAIAAYLERTKDDALDVYDMLTAREREVLQLAAEGLSNPAIGERLSISTRTVEFHRAGIMHKLGLKNQTELVLYAVRRGLLDVDR